MTETLADLFNQALEKDAESRPESLLPPSSGGDPAAPWGYKPDGTPRKTRPGPGRPRKSPSLDELKQDKAESAAGTPTGDRAPQPQSKRQKREEKRAQEEASLPPFREGQIARGVNRLYRKAGRIIRAMDPEIGTAVIEATRKDDEDDLTVGEAWEEVARTNPRIRRFLLKMMKGGAWGQLFWAHAPILMAILMKESIRSHIPFFAVADAFLSSDEDGESPADGTPFDGLQPEDMQQMMGMAQQMAAQMFGGRGFAPPRAPEPPQEM